MTGMYTIAFVFVMIMINLLSIVELRLWHKKKLWKTDRLEVYLNALAEQVADNEKELRRLYIEFHNYKGREDNVNP
jgi:hypothetical protein